MKKYSVNLILGLMCFLLVVGIMIQSKTVKNSKTTIAKTTAEAELRDSILRYQEKYDKTYDQLNNSNNKLDELIEKASKSSENNTDYPNKLKNLNTILGYTDVEGYGIEIVFEDGSAESSRGLISNYLVHDGDLISIVNLLKSGGAEAISINNERIVSNTAITCAGNIININGKKVGSPFVIRAIGLPEQLYGTVTVTYTLLNDMKAEGVKVSVSKKEKEKILIEKYNGTHNFDFAKNVE